MQEKLEPAGISYNHLLMQVNQILGNMEKDNLSVDDISNKLEEAYVLIEKLKVKLFEAETKVNQIINARNTNKYENEENNYRPE